MEFIKHNFKVGDRVTVEQLNEIEDGIIEAAQSGGSAEEAVETILDGASDITTFAAVENNFADVNNGLNALQLNLNSLAKAAFDSDGNLQTQININKDSINILFDDLGITIDPNTEFPTDDTERISTRALAQYSSDTANILVQELGLNDTIVEEYPTQNTRSIRELIDSKPELIKLDINGSYDQETLKQIFDTIITNNATIRLLVETANNGYRYLDVVSLTQEATEAGERLIGNTIVGDYKVIIEADDGEYSIAFTRPATMA